MLQEHGIAAVIYGGTVVGDDFRDRKVADEWFEAKYKQKLAIKDFEATTKYRFDPKFETGGTLGVNYATLGGRIIAFNYRSVSWTEAERIALNERLIQGHYLKQFNEETIATKSQATCGEPCSAVCKKMRGEFKKDYEPYQALGPLCGIFDQRAAERLNKASDSAGFDGISLGGVLAWLMDCLDSGDLKPSDLGASSLPRWKVEGFDAVADSAHNADLGLELVDAILQKKGMIDFSEGPRKWGRRAKREIGTRVLDRFVYTANGRRGWMVPNQYWTPGVLAPMGIMGKYYMHYGAEFLPPRKLGQACAERLRKELAMDNAGICRFHRGWGEGDDARGHRLRVRTEGRVPRIDTRRGEPDQQPQRRGLLGKREEPGVRGLVPPSKKGRRRRCESGARRMDSRFRKGSQGGGLGFFGSRSARASMNPSATSSEAAMDYAFVSAAVESVRERIAAAAARSGRRFGRSGAARRNQVPPHRGRHSGLGRRC